LATSGAAIEGVGEGGARTVFSGRKRVAPCQAALWGRRERAADRAQRPKNGLGGGLRRRRGRPAPAVPDGQSPTAASAGRSNVIGHGRWSGVESVEADSSGQSNQCW